jgi:hypothetical protein
MQISLGTVSCRIQTSLYDCIHTSSALNGILALAIVIRHRLTLPSLLKSHAGWDNLAKVAKQSDSRVNVELQGQFRAE